MNSGKEEKANREGEKEGGKEGTIQELSFSFLPPFFPLQERKERRNYSEGFCPHDEEIQLFRRTLFNVFQK